MQKLPDPLTKAAVDAAAYEITVHSPAAWPRWVSYLLQLLEIDGGATEDELRQALENMRQDITTRLDHGSW
jgi:hypothetical protein